MLRVLLQALAVAFLGAFNLYGASLIYFQGRLLKKMGLLLLFTVVALLLQKLSRVATRPADSSTEHGIICPCGPVEFSCQGAAASLCRLTPAPIGDPPQNVAGHEERGRFLFRSAVPRLGDNKSGAANFSLTLYLFSLTAHVKTVLWFSSG
jgi:hypothetical protein